MIKQRWAILSRECEALLVPSGMPFIIPSGTSVEITQAKGGSITININGQLARLEGGDADAVGIDPAQIAPPVQREARVATGPVAVEEIWQQLATCYDPEIPVNVVDLGIIYDCQVVSNSAFTDNHVKITMTLTAPGCGMGSIIMQDVEEAAWRVENVTNVTVTMVFDPVWSRDMISDAAKLELGLL